MKIIVDRIPDRPHECLFSNWDHNTGWTCNLYNCKHDPEYLGIHSYKCEVIKKFCPYLQEERRNEN